MSRQSKRRREKKALEILLGHKPNKHEFRKWKESGIVNSINIDTTDVRESNIEEAIQYSSQPVNLAPTALLKDSFPTELPDFLKKYQRKKSYWTKLKDWVKTLKKD